MKKKRLPKAFTTVTPFSKGLAMLLFILFPFVGFYLGMKYQQKLHPDLPVVTPPPRLSAPTVTINLTTNWRTYTLQSLGIQFSVPPFQLSAPKVSAVSSYYPLYNPQTPVINIPKYPQCNAYGFQDFSFIFNLKDTYVMDISIWVPVHPMQNGKAYYDTCEKPLTFPDRTPETTMSTINGKTVFIVKDRNRTGNSGIKDFDEYIFVNNGIVYSFDFENAITDPGGQQQVQQMLNSIQFFQPTLQ